MPRKRKLINKVATKKFAEKCFFCGVDDYACLNCHRIMYNEKDNIYSEQNTVCCCANCHAKIHDGQIVIDRKYTSTNRFGWSLHFWENGKEFWKSP